MTIATRHRNGLMGMGHASKLDKIKADIVVHDPAAYGDIAPTLDLDFTNIYGAPFSGNLSRATIGGYRVNAKGVLVPTVANEPVIDFGSDGKGLGTRFDPAYTNLLRRSEEFDNAIWGKSNCSVSANSIAAPDANAAADTLNTTTSNGGTYQSAAMSSGSTVIHTASLYIRQGTSTQTQFYIQFESGGTTNAAVASINWSTLAVSVTGAANNKSYSLEDCGNGWYRLSISGSNSGGANTSIAVVVVPDQGTTGTIYAWGAQLTATAFPVPYVPTTSATVARNLDTFSISGTDFTDAFNPLEGTIFVDAFASRTTSGYPRLVQFDDGSDNNRSVLYFDAASARIYASSIVSNVATAALSFPVTAGAALKVAYSYKANAFNAALNGMVSPADTSGAVPSALTRFWIGNGELSEHFRRLIYWPRALSALDLKRITA